MAERVLGGRYTVQDRIGTGGMAIVYRGLDEVLGRTVAIKTMLPQYAADPSFAARFKQEAQAAAALQSPYIVSVYDWGKDGDTYYIVMEYLRGTDLKSGIRKHGALDSKKVAQIGSQIAQALSVAHRHDIIHRDIKPQNIMVQPDGNIKVMDFGIARAKNSHLTTDNSVLGTAHYVSPEQTQGKELGPTTDIYSLGIVMYEAATGRVPFDGDDAISVALKQVNEQPVPPTAVNPAVDSALESIILKCMQKDPKDRFQTADELYHVLRDYLAGRLAAVNNATEVLPANPVVPAIAPIGATSTQSLPRIDTAEHIKPQTATQKAQQEADAKLYQLKKEAEADRFQREQEAEAQKAEAEAAKFAKMQEAEGIAAVGKAEADAIRAKGLAEADGINAKAEAMKKYGEAAILEMYFKALPDVVKNAAMPLTQVDKITMYGDGNSSKLVGDIIGSTTKITDGLTEATGIDLRALLAGFLGGKLADTGNTAAVAEAIAAAKKSVEDEYADGEDFSTDLEDF